MKEKSPNQMFEALIFVLGLSVGLIVGASHAYRDMNRKLKTMADHRLASRRAETAECHLSKLIVCIRSNVTADHYYDSFVEAVCDAEFHLEKAARRS